MILKDLERLSEEAVKLGATEAKPIRTSSVVTAEWVRLKCQFGCGGYNQHLTCPPFSPTPATTRKILGEFKWAILLKFKPSGEVRNVIKEIERKFFLLGYYKAFGLASGPCEFCEKCNVKEGICKYPDKARPSMEACGIDVYATVRGADFSIEVVKTHNDTPTYYGLVLVE